MSYGEPLCSERLILYGWSRLVLIAVVVFAVHDASVPVVIRLIAVLHNRTRSTAAPGLRRQHAPWKGVCFLAQWQGAK
jgi:hypothetical protein